MTLILLILSLIGSCFGGKHKDDNVLFQDRSAKSFNFSSVNASTTAFAFGGLIFVGINAAFAAMHLASKGRLASSKAEYSDPSYGGPSRRRKRGTDDTRYW